MWTSSASSAAAITTISGRHARKAMSKAPGAVDGEADGQLLDRHVVDHLVIAALQEGRVERAERLHPGRGHAGAERHRVLLGNADIEAAAREALGEEVEAGAFGHRGGDRDDALIALGFADQALGEDLGVGRRVRGRLLLGAGHHVELADAVVLVGGGLGGGVTLALLRQRVDEDRPGAARLGDPEDRDEALHVVPVDRADIGEAEFLEKRATDGHALHEFPGAAGAVLERGGQELHGFLGGGAQILERLAGVETGEVLRHGADRRSDRHLVVVQDDEEPLFHVAGVVHGLIGHAGGHGAVADHADHVADARGAEIACHGEAEAGGDRCGGVRRSEGIVLAFVTLGEAREAAGGAERANAVAAAGQDLVGIALMSHVPDQLVLGRVEDGVDRHGQLDNAEAGAEVAAGDGDRRDRLGSQLVSDPAEFRHGEATQVGG
jgi:hypothetical protein